ncbi:MAG: hypothetical protein U0K25_07495 [Streptococcus sp.]|nr:hypothetical protein [Streptococcus sp.]
MLYSNKLTAIGNLKGDSVFYDEEKEEFYLVSQKQGRAAVTNTVIVGLMLVCLPLIRWLNDSLRVDGLIFRIILLVISSLFVVFLAYQYLKRTYFCLELERLYFNDFEFRQFLVQEERNAKFASMILYILFLLILMSVILYLTTTVFLFLFLAETLLFPWILFLTTKPWKRQSIIRKLSKIYK